MQWNCATHAHLWQCVVAHYWKWVVADLQCGQDVGAMLCQAVHSINDQDKRPARALLVLPGCLLQCTCCPALPHNRQEAGQHAGVNSSLQGRRLRPVIACFAHCTLCTKLGPGGGSCHADDDLQQGSACEAAFSCQSPALRPLAPAFQVHPHNQHGITDDHNRLLQLPSALQGNEYHNSV